MNKRTLATVIELATANAQEIKSALEILNLANGYIGQTCEYPERKKLSDVDIPGQGVTGSLCALTINFDNLFVAIYSMNQAAEELEKSTGSWQSLPPNAAAVEEGDHPVFDSFNLYNLNLVADQNLSRLNTLYGRLLQVYCHLNGSYQKANAGVGTEKSAQAEIGVIEQIAQKLDEQRDIIICIQELLVDIGDSLGVPPIGVKRDTSSDFANCFNGSHDHTAYFAGQSQSEPGKSESAHLG